MDLSGRYSGRLADFLADRKAMVVMAAPRRSAKKCLGGHERCNCKMSCCTLDPARAAQIAADARSGRRWSQEVSKGFGASPACRCGVQRKTLATTIHGRDDGTCPAHPKEA